MESVDLLVVGAGFAGLACAQAGAARGLRTIVLDRKGAAGAACHTTGILVKEVADAWDVPRRLTRKIHGVRLYSPSGAYVDLASPGYYFLATDAPAVLSWLADEAQSAGAALRWNSPFLGARATAGSVHLPDRQLACRFLVGADGARSAVARAFALGENRSFLVGAEVELLGVRGVHDDLLHVFLDSQLAPGYVAWAVPGVGAVQVGLATRGPLAGKLERLLARLGRRFDLSRAHIVARRGGLIPCGGPVWPPAAWRVLLLGDAAGTVSPLTAGGIQPALDIGRAAGVAISNHLLDGAPHPARVVRALTPSYAWKRLLRAACDLTPPNGLVDFVFERRLFRQLAQTIFFHHRGLFSFAAWRDMALAVR